jgi:hypothetical protein
VIALIELGMIAPEDIVKCLRKANSEPEPALAAPVQEPFDHQQAASTALRESMNRSNAIAKNTVPTLQKRPQNCGTGYCSCVECVMEPAVPDAFGTREGEHPQYIQGWNDCRAETLKMRKP